MYCLAPETYSVLWYLRSNFFVRFFERIEDTINCFRDLLTFSILRKMNNWSSKENKPQDCFWVYEQIYYFLHTVEWCTEPWWRWGFAISLLQKFLSLALPYFTSVHTTKAVVSRIGKCEINCILNVILTKGFLQGGSKIGVKYSMEDLVI